MTIRIIRRTILPPLAGLALPVCAALRPGVLTKGARDVAYGPHPRQRMDIYEPSGGGSAPKPVVSFNYGGSWANGAKETYSFVGDALSARGFVPVIADYRLVPEVLCGWLPRCKGVCDGLACGSGAVLCPACSRGH